MGVVTLDALGADGKVYLHGTRDVFGADTLTSRPIRLDSLFNPIRRVIRIQDSIYFSFYYQPGGGTFRTIIFSLSGNELGISRKRMILLFWNLVTKPEIPFL
jgi:hypothetical protein